MAITFNSKIYTLDVTIMQHNAFLKEYTCMSIVHYLIVCSAEGYEHKFGLIFFFFFVHGFFFSFFLFVDKRGMKYLKLNYNVIMTLLPGPWIISRERSFLFHFITKLKIQIICPNLNSRPSAGHTTKYILL